MKYGDQVKIYIHYQDETPGIKEMELAHGVSYTFLCLNSQGKAVLENPVTHDIFLAAHVKLVDEKPCTCKGFYQPVICPVHGG